MADTAYQSKKNEAFIGRGMFESHIHHTLMSRLQLLKRTARGTAKHSAARLAAGQKAPRGPFHQHHRYRLLAIDIKAVSMAYNFQPHA
ncbi:hypothetical protein [Altererythrobacter rubellus]|uniref:Uncharacterized protein n=1 Tax=Altererythrobacter rubellus TaxID=2173831 RepID=A0A9Y2B5T5_9SPHN|nr:hypothetical protein [Altererythrobacter rubellus]WIW95944.1 hypothetical protein QQX03_02220 [Altererythrobacter rubellus]